MLFSLFLKPLLALILLAIITSLLSPIVMWKKLSYFGDAMSHSMILGLVMSINMPYGTTVITIFFALLFILLFNFLIYKNFFNQGSIIMMITYFCLSLAIIINDISAKKYNFNAFIFGDILTINQQDLAILLILSCVVVVYLLYFFDKILLIIINQDLAYLQKIPVNFLNIANTMLLGIVIAIAVKIVGVFLVTALLIAPACLARIFAKSPKQMLFFSLIFAISLSICGICIAFSCNLSLAATIIFCMVLIFFVSIALKTIMSK